MLEIIKSMIQKAESKKDYELAKDIKNLIDELSSTYNAPSNWRDIGEVLAEEINSNSWVYNQLELWNHEE